MNQYGVMAREHWARWLPDRYAAISDPDSFFSDLGEEASQRITDLTADLAGSDPVGEDYLAKAGRLNMAKLQAEEIVLPELILLVPEPGASEEQEDQDTTVSQPELPLIVDRSHPRWAEVNAEQQELARG
jgi:hypothetical protein